MGFPWQLARARLNGSLDGAGERRGSLEPGAVDGIAMNANLRNFALWVIIFLLVLALVTLFQSPSQKQPSSEILFSQLLSEVDAGHVRDVTIAGPEIAGHYKDGHAFQTYAPSDPQLVETLYNKGVAITAKPPSDGNSWLLTLLINGLPLLLFLGV